MKPALVLVDLQQDYLDSPALQPTTGELIARVAKLLERCRAAAIPVIHVRTTVHREPDDRMPHWQRDGKWICVDGTAGHASPLPPWPSETVLHKTGFSAFVDGSLDTVLRAGGIDTLWLAGVQLQSCIRATALDAYQRGWTVWIVADAVGSEDPLHAAVTHRYLEARAVQFVPADRLPGGAIADERVDVACATAKARHAGYAWCKLSLNDRAEMLIRLAALIEAESPALARQMVAEIHKPLRYGNAELERSVALIDAAIRYAREPWEAPCGEHSRERRCPRGVIAVITPWNNPVAIPVGRLAPALLYGNTVVWKPAPAAAGIAVRLMALLETAGIPPDVVNLVNGDATVAERLMADPAVDAVVLTGSEAAGWTAQVICAQRRVPLQAELGGNNAAIVWSDTDLAAAATAVAEAAFGFAGQRCTANRRVILDTACRDAFLEHLHRAVATLDPRTDVGTLISTAKRDQVAALVARTGGLLLQGPADPMPGYFPPTVIQCDNPAAEIVQEETFGPVLVVQPARDFEDALRLCNGVRHGLVAALFSRSAERQARFLETAQAGILKLDRATADADAEAPFGGWKASGIGPPEHGRSNRAVYTRIQAIYQ
ncbi:MAG: aldehyde dehydrogenase family protein [Candidatus Competibacteraceae bacterium]